MGIVVASGSSPSAYIRGFIRRIDRGDPNVKNKVMLKEPKTPSSHTKFKITVVIESLKDKAINNLSNSKKKMRLEILLFQHYFRQNR